MSYLKIRKLLTAVCIVSSVTLLPVLQAKEINVMAVMPEGGNTYRQAQMLADSLTKTGYKVNFVKTNSCVNTKHFFENNPQTPAIYLFTDLLYNEFLATECDLPLTKDNFVTTVNFRINALCSAAAIHPDADSAMSLFKSTRSITIASVTSTPPSVIESFGAALGKKVTMVPYAKTSDSVRGVLSKDADFWYGGLTAGIAGNEQLFCWANTGPKTINNMIPLKELTPAYQQSEYGSYGYIQSNGLDANTKKVLKQDLDAIFADGEWSTYFSKGYMIPGDKLRHIGVDQIIKNTNLNK